MPPRKAPEEGASNLERRMTLGEARTAVEAATDLVSALRTSGRNDVDFQRLRSAYLNLLDRRGYFVGSPAELGNSISEIQNVGPGFDLYDLSEALAEVDATATDCLGLAPSRRLPELTGFVPHCRCSSHSKGGRP